MSAIDHKTFDEPDESRTPDKTKVDVVRLGETEVGRFTFQPGWRWSECIKPVVGTESCQVDHVGYVGAGRMHVEHDDGSTATISAGEAYRIAPGTMPGWRATRSLLATSSRVPPTTRKA